MAVVAAVGIVTLGVGVGAEFTIVVLRGGDAEGEGIEVDLGRKVDLVMRRPDAGGELDDEITGAGAVGFFHRGDGSGNDAELAAVLAGVEEGDGDVCGIDEVNSGAVGDVDPEKGAGSVGHEAIDSGKVVRAELRDGGDGVGVDLLGSPSLLVSEAEVADGLGVKRGEAGEGFGLGDGDIDTGNAGDEGVADESVKRGEGRKGIEDGGEHGVGSKPHFVEGGNCISWRECF